MDQPKPVEDQNPKIKRFLAPLAQQIADETKTLFRHAAQNPDCDFTAGTVSCLEAGGEMCTKCDWWNVVMAPDDE